MSETTTKTPAAKTTTKTPATKPAPAKTDPKTAKVTGPRAYATKDVTPAMVNFTKWIAREFPELKVSGPRDERLVMIASKAYGYFQASDLNK